MSISDADYDAWLISSKINARCVLVEVVVNVSGVETTRYLSTSGYNTGAADTPANTTYLPLIIGDIDVDEELSIDGAPSMSFGEIELINPSGKYDAWLNDIWVNRSIKVWIGDRRWIRSDFRLELDGIVADIDPKSRNRLSIKIRDKLQKLNTPVSDVTLGGTSPNKDALIPLSFGETFNVKALLVDDPNHEYQIHNGPVEDIIEVRDNGVPVAFTKYLSTGKFRLSAKPYGEITASIQGDKPAGVYNNTIATIIQELVTRFGKASDRLVAGDIDSANFTAFNAANSQSVGVYLSDRANVINVCQELAASVDARLIMSPLGKLQLIQIAVPTSATYLITGDDVRNNTFSPGDRLEVQGTVKLGYCKNYNPQYYPDSGILEEHKVLLKDEYRTITTPDATTIGNYKLDAEPLQQNTLLVNGAEATAETTRRLNFRKVQRMVYEFEGVPGLNRVTLGQAVALSHSRFGFAGGKYCLVVRRRRKLRTLRVTLGVLA